MATKTYNVTKQYMADNKTGGGSGAANPGDLHIPIGRWDAGTGLPWQGRALLYAPVSFSGMTSINSARLYLRAHAPSSGWHAKGTTTATLNARRKTADWSETSGGISSAVDEIWGGDGSSYVNNNIIGDTGDETSIPSMSHDTWYYINITDSMTDWFNGSSNYGVMIYNDTNAASDNYAKEFWSRHKSGSVPYMWIDYDTNTAPNAPTGLSPTGSAVVHTGTSVTVRGTRSDPDSGDYITGVTLYMYKDDGVTRVDSETYYPSGTPTTFSRSMSVPNGHAYYKWKARTRDRENIWGAYTSLQRFKANSPPNAPTISLAESPTSSVKTLTPTLNIIRSDSDSPYGDDMDAYEIDLETSAGSQIWASGSIPVSAGTTTVQKLYNGPALSWETAYRWRARTRDENSSWGPYASYVTFTTYVAGTPTGLSPTGNVVTSTLTPTLSASRATSDYTIASYNIELYESNGTTLKWSSGTLTSGITNGASIAKVYNGAALSYSTQYKWRIYVTGNIGGTSNWTSKQSFTTRSADEVEQTAPVGAPITTLVPTFTGTWSSTLNTRQIILYAANGTTQIWNSGEDAQTASTSFSSVYDGTALAWNTTYQWKVRVKRSADNVWQSYSGLESFTTDSAGQPALTAPINNSWQTTLTPTFTGTTFGGEVISTFRILVYEADGISLKWDSGDLAGASTSFSKLYNGAAMVAGRSYKWKARYIKSTGPTGNYSAFGGFHLNALPQSPIDRIPATGAVLVSTLLPTFTATYADDDMGPWGDFPNLFEIEVRNNATDALIATQTLTTGLIAGTNAMVWDGTPALAYETTYKWRARYRDSKSVYGAYSSYNTFKPSQPSTVAITGPSGSITSPQVPVTWNFASPSSKGQGSYRVRVIRNDDEVLMYDSNTVLSSSNQHIIPAGYLVNNTAYTFEVTTLDTDGI